MVLTLSYGLNSCSIFQGDIGKIIISLGALNLLSTYHMNYEGLVSIGHGSPYYSIGQYEGEHYIYSHVPHVNESHLEYSCPHVCFIAKHPPYVLSPFRMVCIAQRKRG